MAEVSNEFKLDRKILTPLQLGFIGLLCVVVGVQYRDNKICMEGRREDAAKNANEFIQYAKEVGELKKEEIMNDLQPQIDDTKEQTDSMVKKINLLTKHKKK